MRPNREDAPTIENYVERLENYADVLEDRIARMNAVIGELKDDLTTAKDAISRVLYRHRWVMETADRGTCDCDTCRYLLWRDGEAACDRDREMTPEDWQAMEGGACPLWDRGEE